MAKKINKINLLVLLNLFIVLLIHSPSFADNMNDINQKKLNRVISYGLAYSLYWEDGFSYWSYEYKGHDENKKYDVVTLKSKTGQTVHGELRGYKSVDSDDDEDSAKIYFVVFRGITDGFYPLKLTFVVDGDKYWFLDIDSEEEGDEENTILINKDLSFTVPSDFKKIAKENIKINNNDLKTIKKIYLKHINQGKIVNKNIQKYKIYIGPISDISADTWIYWPAGDELLWVPISKTSLGMKGGRDFNCSEPVGVGKDYLLSGKNEVGEEVPKPYFDKLKVENCIKDGTELLLN